MQQYRFWTTVTVNGAKQRREFVLTAENWTAARRMMSEAMKHPQPA
jgi:hypothetical protein